MGPRLAGAVQPPCSLPAAPRHLPCALMPANRLHIDDHRAAPQVWCVARLPYPCIQPAPLAAGGPPTQTLPAPPLQVCLTASRCKSSGPGSLSTTALTTPSCACGWGHRRHRATTVPVMPADGYSRTFAPCLPTRQAGRPAPQLRAEQAKRPGDPSFPKGAALCGGLLCRRPPRLLRCVPTRPAPRLCPQAHLTRGTDRELLYLSAYLGKIAALDSLAGLNHKCVVLGGGQCSWLR